MSTVALSGRPPTGHRYATEPAVILRGETVDPEWLDRNQAELDGLRTVAFRHMPQSDDAALMLAGQFVPRRNDPPDAPHDDHSSFVTGEAC